MTAVLPAGTARAVITGTARAVITGTAAHPCQASVDEFIGVQGTLLSDYGLFYRMDVVPVAVVGPDVEQRAVGQDWGGVPGVPTGWGRVGTAAGRPLPPRSLATPGGQPVLHGLLGADGAFQVGNCFAPHPAEVIGAARLPAWTTPEAATAACREIAVATMGSPAALDRGDLDVRLQPIRPDPTNDRALLTGPAAQTTDGKYDTACLVVPLDPPAAHRSAPRLGRRTHPLT